MTKQNKTRQDKTREDTILKKDNRRTRHEKDTTTQRNATQDTDKIRQTHDTCLNAWDNVKRPKA